MIFYFYSVTPAPVKLTALRINSTAGSVSWSPSLNAVGYEVHYKSVGEEERRIITSKTKITLTGLRSNSSYDITVIAYGEDLPSEESTVTLQKGIDCYLMHLPILNISRGC